MSMIRVNQHLTLGIKELEDKMSVFREIQEVAMSCGDLDTVIECTEMLDKLERNKNFFKELLNTNTKGGE